MINPLLTLSRGARQLLDTRAEAHVPVARQLRQLAMMRAANGTSRVEYFKYRIWRPDLEIVDRLCYTSQRERRLSEEATNRGHGSSRPRGKSASAERIVSAGVPMAVLLGRVGRDEAATVRTRSDLAELLSREGVRPLVIKPELGMQGDNILVAVHSDAAGITLLSGRELTTAELWRQLEPRLDSGWRVERWVVPHPLVARWRPGATPTIRFLTLMVGGEAVVHAATIKVPVGDSGVDNLAKGNLVSMVDLTNGSTGSATDGEGQRWWLNHPESGRPIAGITIPGWDRYLSVMSLGAAALLPRRAIGWDVAVGVDGPVVLEANSKWCEKLVQLPSARGLTRGPFIRLLHEAGAGKLLARRRRLSREWREFEDRALEGSA